MPRLTRKLFTDLCLWMIALGILTGLIFPFFVLLMEDHPEQVLRPAFFFACVAAGMFVGVLNSLLARTVVRPRLRLLVGRMRTVASGVRRATFRGDWTDCGADDCTVPVESEDELGESAGAFNDLVAAVRRSHEVERALATFSHAIALHADARTLATEGLDRMLQDDLADAGLVLAHRDGGLDVLASVGMGDGASLRESAPVLRVLRTGVVQRLSPDDRGGVRIRGVLGAVVPREVVIVPLHAGTEVVGALVLASQASFSLEAMRLIELFGGIFALALQSVLTHERLERLASIDSLTRVYCRRYGLARLRETFERARTDGRAMSLLLLDLDHFKAVNDTHGHLVGDRVLVLVADAVRDALRDGDVVVRYGGEEFLVVLPGATPADARAIAERLRQSVRAGVVHEGGRAIRATVSIGAVCYPATPAADEQQLIRDADAAMYAAKLAGRDRVAVSGEPMEFPTAAESGSNIRSIRA